jgi:hypothetical protein
MKNAWDADASRAFLRLPGSEAIKKPPENHFSGGFLFNEAGF